MLALLLGLLLLFIALLAIPLQLSYRLSWHQALSGKVRLRWGFGLVQATLPLSSTGSGSPPAEPPLIQPAEARQAARKSRSNPGLLKAMRQRPFRRRLFNYLAALWRAIGRRDLELQLRIGLGDPAETGQLWALLGPLAGILAGSSNSRVSVEPEFLEQVFELDSHGDIRVVPLQIVGLTLGLLLSPTIWRGLRQARQ